LAVDVVLEVIVKCALTDVTSYAVHVGSSDWQ